MRNQKGFSLIELLAVGLIMALIAALITVSFLGEINNARGSARVNHARMVYSAAHLALIESAAFDDGVSDDDYMAGLSGTADDPSQPVPARLSQRMAEILASDVILSDTPSEDAAHASFIVENGVIISMSYEIISGGRLFTITITDGETVIAHKKVT